MLLTLRKPTGRTVNRENGFTCIEGEGVPTGAAPLAYLVFPVNDDYLEPYHSGRGIEWSRLKADGVNYHDLLGLIKECPFDTLEDDTLLRGVVALTNLTVAQATDLCESADRS